MKAEPQRARRTDAERIAALQSQLTQIRARAEHKRAQRSPALRHVLGALRSIDKALAGSSDVALRTALDQARATLSACASLQGVVVPPGHAPEPATGRRRSGSDLADLSSTLLDYVRQHPGQRGEQIAAALSTPTNELRRPMKALITAGKVTTRGQRRGTTYFAG